MSELRQRRPTGRNEEEEESSGRQNTDGKVGSGSDTKDHAGRGVRKWILVFGIAASCAVFAGCLYASTLTAEFIFDDHFKVAPPSCADVTSCASRTSFPIWVLDVVSYHASSTNSVPLTN
eukprot:3137451-Rhodomonas_salina.1